MKKAALLILTLTISSSLFACWGGSRSGFWEDALRIATPISATMKALKPNNQVKVVNSAIAVSPWTAMLDYLKTSYLIKMLPNK